MPAPTILAFPAVFNLLISGMLERNALETAIKSKTGYKVELNMIRYCLGLERKDRTYILWNSLVFIYFFISGMQNIV